MDLFQYKNLTKSIDAFTSQQPPQVIIMPKPDLIAGIPDGILALIAPVVVYWLYSLFFHTIDMLQLAEKYRIHPSEEVLRRNRASRWEVFKDVVLQHVIQTVIGYFFYTLDPPPSTGYELNDMWKWKQKLPYLPGFAIYLLYNYGMSLLKLCVAFLIIDSWQYWLHRTMHVNKWLYKRFHSRHHRLYIPYAYGALYNDPVEGFLLDTLGTGIASIVTQLTPREAIVLYTFATMKTVDDHCGYAFPYDIFQIIFPNNSIYHDIHHQQFGIKSNFSQPFFIFWDKLTGTEYKLLNQYKADQKKVTAEKYKQFLLDRRNVALDAKKDE